jgi:hypothetical protein
LACWFSRRRILKIFSVFLLLLLSPLGEGQSPLGLVTSTLNSIPSRNEAFVSKETVKTKTHMLQQVWHDKDPSLLKGLESRAKA